MTAGEDDFGPEEYGEGEASVDDAVVGRKRLRVAGPEDENPWVMKGRKIAPTVGNAVIMLAGSKDWRGLRWNKFRGEPSISDPPKLAGFDPPNPRLDDYAAAYVAHWLGLRKGLLIGDAAAAKAAEIASKAIGRAHHPVREYLQGLEWDGVRRLDTFVPVYLGGEATAYTAAAWRCWMISAVARVMRPGCQVHHVPILEGKQGSGKSSAVRALVPNVDWMNDSPIKIGHADGMDALRGHWLVEFAELESMSGRESSKVKAFISSAVDTFRKAYGKDTEKFPRQCVMIGTVNPEEGYLRDPTGNRRFWPLKTGDIQVDTIARDRDQLWAEAFVLFEDGKPWHFEDADLIAMATEEQSTRTIQDPWEEAIVAWLNAPTRTSHVQGGITIPEVLSGAVQVLTKDHDDRNASRVGTILRRNGFAPRGRARPRKYFREGSGTEVGADDDFGPTEY